MHSPQIKLIMQKIIDYRMMKHFSISDCIARCDNGVGASPRIEWTTEEETGHKHKQTGSYYETDSGTSRL